MTPDTEPPEQPPDESPSPAPIGRRFALILGLVVAAAVVGTAIGSGIVDLRDLGIGQGTCTSPTASAAPPVSSEPNREASTAVAASLTPGPLARTAVWATVLDDAEVQSEPSVSSASVDTVCSGQLVFVHSTSPTHSGDTDLYDVESAPDVRGWIDADALNLDAVNGSIEWCAVPSKSVYKPDSAQPFYKLSEELILGDVPLQTRMFSLAALGTADLAWGSRTQVVCAVLRITDGAVSSATFHAEIDTCAKPYSGAYGWGLDFGTAAVGPNGEMDQRYVMPNDSVLGYSQVAAVQVNPDEVVQLAGAGNSFADLLACVHVTVTGGHDDTTVHTIVRADVCATVVAREAGRIVVRGIPPWNDSGEADFTLNPGSEIDPAIGSGATLGMTIEGDGGIDGAVRIRPTPVEGCEAAAT